LNYQQTLITGNGQCFCSCFTLCTTGFVNQTDCSCNPCFSNAGLPVPGTPCNDGNVCTANDTCTVTGSCVGTNICINPCSGFVCPPIPCNNNQCGVVGGTATCLLSPVSNGTPCSNGYCTNGQCHSKVHSAASRNQEFSAILMLLSLFIYQLWHWKN